METIIACGLLLTILSITTKSIVRNRRLQTEQRHYRLALNELTNALDRFTQLPAAELASALESWRPSPFALRSLPDPRVQGTLVPEALGTRITVAIEWDDVGRRGHPLQLVGWGLPEPIKANQGVQP